MLTLYGNSSSAAYDDHGCLSDLNEITTAHNEALGDQMVKLRNEYPALNLFYGDLHGVYTDILDNPVDYSTFKSNHFNYGLGWSSCACSGLGFHHRVSWVIMGLDESCNLLFG